MKRAITPKAGECTNLLVPVALSASHVAWTADYLPKEHLPLTPRFNPRRIHSSWIRKWAGIDYHNDWQSNVA